MKKRYLIDIVLDVIALMLFEIPVVTFSKEEIQT
jgi:hypothetical protein